MNDLQKVLCELTKITNSIKSAIKQSTYDEYDDLSGLDIDYTDPEQLLLLDQLTSIMDMLDDVGRKIDYLNKPITYTGVLSQNSDGRYELLSGDYYTTGYDIEFLLDADNKNNVYEVDMWVLTTVEHDNNDYYLRGYKGISMEGLMARTRR